MRRPAVCLAVVLIGLVPIAGCGTSNGPLFPTAPPDPLAGMPLANTPAGLLRAFEWTWNNRSLPGYRLLFTEDFEFTFASVDTAGNPSIQHGTRADELIAFENLVADAKRIDLVLDKSFAVFNDTRPGIGDSTTHKTVRTQVLLNIDTTNGNQTNVQGQANFFLVRGDVALIPPDTGLRPDSTRWFIQRWEAETLAGSPGFRSGPSQDETRGSVKLRYRFPIPSANAPTHPTR